MIQRDYLYNYNDKKIPYKVWFSDDDKKLETIIFLGTVQIEKIPEWVAEKCPPGTAVVQGAPHWFAKCDGSDVIDYVFHYTEDAFKNLIRERDFRGGHIIADSQAAASAVRLFALYEENRPYLKDMVLVQPSGFNADIFDGVDNDQRIDIFKKRIVKNTQQQFIDLILDGRLRYNYKTIYKVVSFSDPKSRAQYGVGLKHDALPNLGILIRFNENVKIICGEKDELFPPEEIKTNLERKKLPATVVTVKGIAHASLASKKGFILLEKAFSLLDS